MSGFILDGHWNSNILDISLFLSFFNSFVFCEESEGDWCLSHYPLFFFFLPSSGDGAGVSSFFLFSIFVVGCTGGFPFSFFLLLTTTITGPSPTNTGLVWSGLVC